MGIVTDLLKEVPLSVVLREQIVMLDKEIASLRTENAELKAKVAILETENADLKIANSDLKAEIARIKRPQKKLDAETEQLVQYFFTTGRELTAGDVASALTIDIGTVDYHFDLLFEAGLIMQTRAGSDSGEGMYEITPSGRKYVVENKIMFTP